MLVDRKLKENQRKKKLKIKEKRMMRWKSKRYSKNVGRLHQNSDLEARQCGKTCKRGPIWSCDVSDT